MTTRAADGTTLQRNVLVALCVILAIAAVAGEVAELRNVATRQTDFGTFYRAAEAVRTGGDPYLVANREYFYPPTFAIAMVPLTWVPITYASVIWFVLKCAMVVAALRMTYAMLAGGLAGAARGWFGIGVLLVACRFWMTDLRFGNTNVVVLFLSLLSLWAAERMQNRRAGAWLAIAATIKLVPAVLAGWFVAGRRYAALVWFAIWLLAINLIPLAVRPTEVGRLWSSYRQHGVDERMNARLDEPDNQSLRGVIARSTADPAKGKTIWLLLVGILASATLGTISRLSLSTVTQRTIAASTLFLYGLLASPGSWVVHYTAALLPMAAALRLLLEPGPRRTFLMIAFTLANLVYTGSTFSRFTVRLAADRSLFVVATLVLLAALLWELRRITPGSAAPSAHPATPPPPLPDRR